MSTIASLLSLIDPSAGPYTEDRETLGRIAHNRQLTETGLLHLAELKRQQEAAAQARGYFAANPEAALGQGGGSVLGALQTAPGGPPGGTMMQQTTIPGQPLGAPQVVPGGQDLSRFATQGGPPQSTLGSLAPPPQVNPLEQLMRQNPDAAFQVIGQQQKMLTTQLTMREKTAEAFAAKLQGVNSQESYEAAVQDLAQWAPQQAARLPKVWSKEAVQPFIDSALSAKDKATLDVNRVAAQAELAKARMSGRVASTDQYLKALGVTPGQETPQDMQRALELQTQHQAQIQAANVTPQIVQGEGGGYWAVNPRTLERRPVGGGGGATGVGTGAGAPGTDEQLRAPMTEGQAKTAGYTSRMQTGQEQMSALEKSGDYTTWKAPLSQLPGGSFILSDKQKEYEHAKGIFLAGLLRYDSAGQITDTEWKKYGELYFPGPNDPPAMVELKRKNREQAIQTHQEMLGRPVPGQKHAPQAQPTTQGASGGQGSQGTLKPVGEMSRDELLAERDRLRGGR